MPGNMPFMPRMSLPIPPLLIIFIIFFNIAVILQIFIVFDIAIFFDKLVFVHLRLVKQRFEITVQLA